MKTVGATSVKRTALAMVLTLTAVAAPCGAWFVAGWRDVQRQMAAEINRPGQQAREAAVRLAEQFGDHLDALREKESKRNVFHYQSLYHDPRGAYAGSGIVPSPLANGPEDPLILAQFQIDANGRVSLPTINDDIPERNTNNKLSQQRLILKKLKPNANLCVAALAEPTDTFWQISPQMSRIVFPEQLALAKQQRDQLAAQFGGQYFDSQSQALPNLPGDQQIEGLTGPQGGQQIEQQKNLNKTNAKKQDQGQGPAQGQNSAPNDNRDTSVPRRTNDPVNPTPPSKTAPAPNPSTAQRIQAPAQTSNGNQSRDQQLQIADAFANHGHSGSYQTSQAQSRRVPLRSFKYYQKQLNDQKPASSSVKNTVTPEVWNQSLAANALYQGIRGGKGQTGSKIASYAKPAAGPSKSKVDAAMKGEVVIYVGGFQWHTLPLLDQKPTLVALRQVHTPMGVWAQGFTIDQAKTNEWLNNRKGSRYPARLVQGRPDSAAAAAPVLIGDSSWYITVDARNQTGKALILGQQIRSQFLWRFLCGTLAALLAGAFVVGMVRQSDRLARQRSQFAASAAHELRTPLAGLRMYGEMLAEGLGDPTKTSTYARRIADESERLGRVVSNVLEFSRLERGALAVKITTGDLSATVGDCVAKQQPALEAAGARIQLKINDDLPDVRFDPDAVFQVLSNLIDNAEKYTRQCDDRGIEVSVDRRGNQALIEVKDHGSGIEPKVRQRLFKPFARGNDPDAPAGLGLGLPLAQALIQAQGGSIKCRSAPDGGAVFEVLLPLA